MRLGHGEKRLDVVAELISGLDVIALEEVMSAEAVGELLGQLPGWNAVTSTAVGRNGYVEHYAVLYRKAAAQLTRAFLADDPYDDFAREPFVVCLDASSFDFCLVAFHATYTGGAKVRDGEIEALGFLVTQLRDQGAEKDWIVVGDFNRADAAAGFEAFIDAGWRCVLEPNTTPTTIGLKKPYARPYDHILVAPRHTTELAGPAERIDLVAAHCADNLRWCREELSDHAPVAATFRIDGHDDD